MNKPESFRPVPIWLFGIMALPMLAMAGVGSVIWGYIVEYGPPGSASLGLFIRAFVMPLAATALPCWSAIAAWKNSNRAGAIAAILMAWPFGFAVALFVWK
ncbi:MAG: hypothetical protein AB7F98_02105 [Novosphingobium sp.]